MMNAGRPAHGQVSSFNGFPLKEENHPYPTEVNILYDDKNMYVAIRAYDKEPDKIQRFAGVRDEFAGDISGH